MNVLAGNNKQTANFLLRCGLALAFLYAAIGSFRTPAAWVGFLPTLLTDHLNGDVLLKFFAVFEILVAVWIMSGKYLRYAAALAALMLLGIVVANPHALDITFRDVSLAFAAAALFFLADK